MDTKQELINAITQNPERRLVVMYDSENGNRDYAYTLGEIQKSKLRKRQLTMTKEFILVMSTMVC